MIRWTVLSVLICGTLALAQEIPGYDYHSKSLAKSPVSMEEFGLLKQAVLFGDADAAALKMSHDVLNDQTEAILDVWYGFVGSHPHLVYYFNSTTTNASDGEYLAAVRKRFGQWILDTARGEYDQTWLDYQYEIGLRHAKAKKGKTDNVATVSHVSFRYLPAFIIPITYTIKPFLAKKGHSAEDVEKMWQAWQKSVTMQTILWSYPYVKDGEF